jgi:hypothetical protein
MRQGIWGAPWGTSAACSTLLGLVIVTRGERLECRAPGGLVSGVCEAPQDRKVPR